MRSSSMKLLSRPRIVNAIDVICARSMSRPERLKAKIAFGSAGSKVARAKLVWTFTYARPFVSPATSAASARSAGSPGAGEERSGEARRIREIPGAPIYAPAVTSAGTPGNVPGKVATPTFPGASTQQWTCATVVVPTRSGKVDETASVCASES